MQSLEPPCNRPGISVLPAAHQFFSYGLHELGGIGRLAIELAPRLAWKGLAEPRDRPSAYSSALSSMTAQRGAARA
ncbi:MAG: hypothetical protein WBV79_12160, partial [Rhodomicrobium sp.]